MLVLVMFDAHSMKRAIGIASLLLLGVIGFCGCRWLFRSPGPPRKECLDCHKEKRTDFARKRVHAPFGDRNCGACHLRHGPANVLKLKSPDGSFCFSCHERQKPAFARGEIHLKSGRCWECHNPHAGGEEKLLRDPGPRLCYRCHGKGRDEGEFTRSAVHSPLKAERGCLTCHFAHSSGNRKQLRAPGNANCSVCHGKT